MSQELVFEIRADTEAVKSSLAGLRATYTSTLSDITKSARQEAQAAATLQRQRSTALITV